MGWPPRRRGSPTSRGSGGRSWTARRIASRKAPEPANASITGQRDRKRQTIIVGGGTDPQLPYQPWAAAKRLDHLANFHTPTKWAHLDPEDRCLLNGVPRSNYRGTMQILQSPGYVTILYEWNHAYRVIPLDGRPHAPAEVKQWNGDSRGRWEGNTLVVDVTNFLVDDAEHNVQPWFDSHGSFYSDALHVVERYTVLNADTIRYEATVEDPKVFTRPWQVGFTVSRNKQPGFELLEEACCRRRAQHAGHDRRGPDCQGGRPDRDSHTRREVEK